MLLFLIDKLEENNYKLLVNFEIIILSILLIDKIFHKKKFSSKLQKKLFVLALFILLVPFFCFLVKIFFLILLILMTGECAI